MSNRRRPAAEPAAVTLAYVHSNEVAHSWHQSVMAMVAHDMAHDARLLRGGWISIRCGTDGLPASRNEAVRQFLSTDEAEWLFWVDTDMGFAPDTVDRLVASADPVERPIMGALCFAQREMHPDGTGGYRCRAAPTIYDWRTVGDKSGFVARQVYQPNAVMKCSGTGSAAIVIHRSVFESIQEEYGPTWYDRAPDGPADENGVRRMMGEDLSFCMRAGVRGFPVHVDTSVKTSHLKPVWLAEDDYLAQYAAEQMFASIDETTSA